jgi:hypothetical protein
LQQITAGKKAQNNFKKTGFLSPVCIVKLFCLFYTTTKEQKMTAKVENNELVIRLPLQEPKESASGKTLVVATSHGNQKTDVVIGGQVLTVGVNAYIKKV